MKDIESLFRLLKKNIKKNKYFSIITLLFIAMVVLVLGTSFVKTAISQEDYIYAKVKVSQGFWWASTQNPSVSFVNSIKKGETEYDLLGKPVAEVLEARYYPILSSRYQVRYDIFLTLRLAASYNNKTQKYLFKRSTMAVGSPIELEFSSTQVSGEIIEISKEAFQENGLEKNIILTKRLAYPWEYDAIKIGDELFDGEEVVFRVTSKRALDTSLVDVSSYGNVNLSLRDPRKFIRVYGKIKLKEKGDRLIFGEEQVIIPGVEISLATENFVFDQFVVQEVK